MAINVNRRDFIKVSGMTAGGLLLPSKRPVATSGRLPLHKALGEGHSICPYCSVGCGLIVATDETGHISNVEGDPDHIINKGALDPKSVSVQQLSTSDRRLKTVKYRAPNSDQWEEKTWDWAISEIGKRVKATRDATYEETDSAGVTVNRTRAIAWLGGAANNNEECYAAAKLMRALGVVWLEHQARI